MTDTEVDTGHHAAHEHVHVSFALFDGRHGVERVLEALRKAGLIGFVTPEYSEAERVGGVSAAIATHGGTALVVIDDGAQPGPPLPELAESLRRRLVSGVIMHDDAGTQLAFTVPPVVGEQMEAALNQPHAPLSVTVTSGEPKPDDIEDLAFAMGGPTSVVPAGDRTALVAASLRMPMIPKELRPAVRITRRDETIELMAWSKHATRWTQSPLRKLRSGMQADLLVSWVGPPLWLVEHGDTPAHRHAIDIQSSLRGGPPAHIGQTLRAALARIARELGLPDGAGEELVALAEEPFDPRIVERLVRLLDLPREVIELVEHPELAAARALASGEPSGAMEEHLRRQTVKQSRR